MSRIRVHEYPAASVATPPADTAEIFFDDATDPGVLKVKKDDGTVVTIESTAGADADAIHDNVAGEIVLITEKATPLVADLLVIEDSAAANVKKRVQLGNLPVLVGDSGAGGVAGYVPAPAAGDAAAGKYLDSDGTWTVPPAGGSLALDDLTDVTLTAPATGAVLVKSAGDWVDGQVDLADADAVTGVLAKANMAATTVHTDQANTYSTGTQDFQSATDVHVKDSAFAIKDNADPTKIARFNASTITTATTRTYDLPDDDTTLVGHDAVQTLTGKTIEAASNTLTIGLNDLSDVSLTAPATGSVLVKSAGDWVDGQVDIADADAITGTLPVGNGGTGITSLGTGVATWLGTPSSANLLAAVTDETGSGALVFGTAPTIAGSTLTGVHDAGGADSFEIPNGAGGTTVNAAGEVCVDTTSRTLNLYDGTAEVVIQPIESKGVTIESPTTSDDVTLFYTDFAITIVKMVITVVGTSTPSWTCDLRHHTSRNNAGNAVITTPTASTEAANTAESTGHIIVAFDDATVPADSWLWVETDAQSGTWTNGGVHLTVFYRQDP